MNVLVACEFSGVVREAFRARGHNAWSCDLLPAEDENNGAYHILGDALDAIQPYARWDLVIAHPPCTYLCNSGVRWLWNGPVKNVPRWLDLVRAATFFASLWRKCERIAIENPIMHKHGLECINARIDWPLPKPHIIQPWMFGHGETKATCLWLKNLPPLKPTNIVEGRTPRVHHASPGPDRWKERSRTLPGIAAAMAEQWGCLGPTPPPNGG